MGATGGSWAVPAVARPRLGSRELFPALEPRVYLNHAAISPPSEAVCRTAQSVTERYAREGLSAWQAFVEQRERLRALLAELIGAPSAADIALVASTTQGVIDVAQCIPWQRGERLVLFRGEFPTNVTPWQRAAALHGLGVVMLDGDEQRLQPERALARLQATLRRGVRLVAVSAVQFQTGYCLPLRAMADVCHQYGAELFVDAVQSVGVVPMDVQELGIDYLACGSHKWLMGLEGCGFVYVHPDRIRALRPVIAGWLSHEDATRFLFAGPGELRHDRPIRARADFFEVGTMNVLGFAALEASVSLLTALGVPAIFAHVGHYLDRLEAGMVERGFQSLRGPAPGRSGMLCVLPPPDIDLAALQAALDDAGISCAMPDGKLRLAPHWPNDPAEVDLVLAVIDAILASFRGRP